MGKYPASKAEFDSVAKQGTKRGYRGADLVKEVSMRELTDVVRKRG
jgi:hypothetical protein